MAEKNEEIEVQIDEPKEAQQELELVIENKKEEPVAVSSNDEAIAELNRKLEEERAARAEAEQRAADAVQKARYATNEIENTNLQLVASAIDQLQREGEILKANLRAAMSNSDFDAAAEIQQSMSTNAARLLQLENGKAAMETRPREAENVQKVNSDPVEAFAQQLSPRSAAWVRRNPQCVTNPRLNQKMIAAHNLAIADGYEADSDDYFAFVEQTVGINKKQEEQQQEESALSGAATATQRRSSPTVAPVSRNAPSNSGQKPNVVRLTAEQREMASMMGMTEKEYATNMIALKKEGKLH